jgi:ribosome-associated translation inhibitor RaiA
MPQFQITFRGMTPSDALQTVAREKFDKLSLRFGPSARCSVVLEHASTKHGTTFHARVQLQHLLGGARVSAAADSESANAAVREAFDRAYAQLLSARHDVARATRRLALHPVLH